MNRLIPLTIFFIASSCSQTTEQKLEKAVKTNYKVSFDSRHESFEELSVKLISYDLTDSSSYFLARLKPEIAYLSTLNDIFLSSAKLPGDPHLKEYASKLDSEKKKVDFITAKSEIKRFPQDLYWIKYHIIYKTTNESRNAIDSAFLHVPDLKEVYVDIDSTFIHQ